MNVEAGIDALCLGFGFGPLPQELEIALPVVVDDEVGLPVGAELHSATQPMPAADDRELFCRFVLPINHGLDTDLVQA
jgi:hypothetical protein